MGALRHTIVDAVCRALAVSDRGYAKKPGNLIDVFVDAGFDPARVLQAAAAAIDVRVVTERLLQRTPPSWPDGVDVSACLAQGVVAMAHLKRDGWCFAYLDPEDAADHEVVGASLDLPPHRPVLGLRAQLLPFMHAADPFRATPTQVLPAPHARQNVAIDDLDDNLERVDSDEDDTFNPSLVDGAPVDEGKPHQINDALNGATLHDADDSDDARPAINPVAAANTTNDDDDFFVDATERLSQATGLKRPASKAQRSPPRDDSTTLTTAAPSPPAPAPKTATPTQKPTKPTTTKPPPPAWNAPPPRVREFPQQAALVALAVVVVVVGGLVAWRFEVFDSATSVGDGIVVGSDGTVDVGPAQRALVQQAAGQGLSNEQRLNLLNRAVAFDPHGVDGLRAVHARAKLLVAMGRKAAAENDLDRLRRGLLAHHDVVAAADLAALNNSVVSMRDP